MFGLLLFWKLTCQGKESPKAHHCFHDCGEMTFFVHLCQLIYVYSFMWFVSGPAA